jgi:hypothetical protein
VARAALGGGAAIIDAIGKARQCSLESSSEARLPTILNLLSGAPSKVFWPVFGTGVISSWNNHRKNKDVAEVKFDIKNQQQPLRAIA